MATIPSGQKFHTVASKVNTTSRASATIDSNRRVYTMQELTDTVRGGSTVTEITSEDTTVSLSNSTPKIITGMTATLAAGTYVVNFNSQYTVDDTSSETEQAKTELISLYNALIALTPTETGHIPTYGSETLSPGVYTQAGATNITGVLTLDAGGDSTALFVFRCGGAFTTGASAEVVLTGGALSSNVWFVAEGASSTGAITVFRGSIISNQAAVSTGALTSIEGRMFSITGAVGIGYSSIFTEPVGTSELTLGTTLSSFNLFTGTGNVTNTGISNIKLSIGANLGTITGFETAIVGGSIVPGGAAEITTFNAGVFVDGVLAANSLRRTNKPFESIGFEYPVILQTVATTTEGQVVDVRAFSSIGLQNVGPRMAFVITKIL